MTCSQTQRFALPKDPAQPLCSPRAPPHPSDSRQELANGLFPPDLSGPHGHPGGPPPPSVHCVSPTRSSPALRAPPACRHSAPTPPPSPVQSPQLSLLLSLPVSPHPSPHSSLSPSLSPHHLFSVHLSSLSFLVFLNPGVSSHPSPPTLPNPCPPPPPSGLSDLWLPRAPSKPSPLLPALPSLQLCRHPCWGPPPACPASVSPSPSRLQAPHLAGHLSPTSLSLCLSGSPSLLPPPPPPPPLAPLISVLVLISLPDAFNSPPPPPDTL